MAGFFKYTGLYTDMYQLTMAQAYFNHGRQDTPASFDYFFRSSPFQNGYVVFAGLDTILDFLTNLHFDKEDIDYLASLGFSDAFLDYLAHFRFNGTIHSIPEGELVFPVEPVLRVEANLIEAQIIETLMLNFLNYESLIATKAARIRQMAGERLVSDFGLRRAHGLGGIQASRAAVIGGCDSTSNVYSAMRYGLKAVGTMAHSYIQSYEDELTAFRKYAETHPDNCILLVDTYDTLHNGVPNAITVGRELRDKGYELKAIRLDSGDLSYMAKQSRKMLDDAGFENVSIVASNQLDEYLIRSLNEQDAPIDIFGIGTKLVTGQPTGAHDGVYKLAMCNHEPRLKISENITKTTLPGLKRVIRFYNHNGEQEADAVLLADEEGIDRMYHPFETDQSKNLSKYEPVELYEQVMANGERTIDTPSPEELRKRVSERVNRLPIEYKRFENPHIYKVGISNNLLQLRNELIRQHKNEGVTL